MQNLLSQSFLIVGRMLPRDAVQFARTCHSAAEQVRLFDAALAFVLTRPGIQARAVAEYAAELYPLDYNEDYPLLDVDLCQFVWQACSESVVAYGLDSSLWACSQRVVQFRIGRTEHQKFGFRGFNFLSELLDRARRGTEGVELIQQSDEIADVSIRALLLVDASECLSILQAQADGLALALLSDGQFALLMWTGSKEDGWDNEDGEYPILDKGGAVIYVGKTIHALFDLVSTTTGDECRWERAEDCYGGSMVAMTTIMADGIETHPSLTVHCKRRITTKDFLHNDTYCALDFLNPCDAYGDYISIYGPEERHKTLGKLTNVLSKSCRQLLHTYPPIQKLDTDTEQVTMPITHEEPPAVRDAEVMQLHADWQWAEHVQSIIQASATDNERLQLQQLSNKVHLISFRSGKGELFRKMLLEGKEFKPLRERLEGAGCQLELPSGALVLVRPDQYMESRVALQSYTLKRYNVVIADSEEYLMNEVLMRMASKLRPRENKAERSEVELF